MVEVTSPSRIDEIAGRPRRPVRRAVALRLSAVTSRLNTWRSRARAFWCIGDVNGAVEVLLVHPGGPFWQNKDQGAWSIPKGEFTASEDPLEAAKREFHEETGLTIDGDFAPVAPLKQPSGKVVHAWLVEGDFDPTKIRSNTFPLEWPRGSGKLREVPEVDRAEWFTIPAAREKILKGQRPLLDALDQRIAEHNTCHSPETS